MGTFVVMQYLETNASCDTVITLYSIANMIAAIIQLIGQLTVNWTTNHTVNFFLL